jgi:UDP-N-acetylmuramyl pentapeptide phosphotransferase/UDP-N-acetylglucosamine-1-phosphate transferase
VLLPLLAAWPWTGLAVALASATMTAAWIALARRRGIEDAPGQRRLHSTTTPRGGGIAIAVVLVLAAAALAAARGATGQGLAWTALAAGFAAFAAVGLLDDLAGLRVLPKFAGQWLAAALLALGIVLAGPDPTPWLEVALVAFAAVFVTNLWNFMDGSNGLVASQSLLVAAALAAWPGQGADLRLAALALAAGCLGFLPFNLPRARVFLGDAGSHVLGAGVFALGVASWRRGVVTLPGLGRLGSALLLDGGLTLAGRAWRRRPVWRAHREHLYQYAVRTGHSHLSVCLAYAAWTTLAIALALATDAIRSTFVATASFILCLAFGTGIYTWLRRRWIVRAGRRQTRKGGRA